MHLLYITLMAIAIVGCGSTTVKKRVELPPLPENHPVTVYTEMPNFRYEVICEIDITRKGNFVSTQLASYKSNIEVEARKCGVDKGLLLGLTGTATTTTTYNPSYGFDQSTGYNIAVHGYGIRQTSEIDKIVGQENIKSLGIAVALDNIAAVKQIIKDVNKNPTKRSLSDDEILTYVVFVNAQKGLKCPQKTIDYFISEYGVRITKLNYDTSAVRSSAENLIFCGDLLTASYSSVENRSDILTYINNSVVDILNFSSKLSKDDLKKLGHLKPVLAKVNKEIQDACAVSETSDVCLFKQRFQELDTRMKKINHK